MLSYLTMGILLGLSAGFAPGPLFAYVVSQTLQNGFRAGAVAALAPLITDIPVVAVSLFFLGSYAQSEIILGSISVIGGCFLFYLGFENFSTKPNHASLSKTKASTLQKAVLVNLLSPHPYLFWITVGGPAVIRGMRENVFAAGAFVGSFYILLIGSKILLSMVTARSKKFLVGNIYTFVMKVLGLSLWVLAVVLIYDGFVLLKIL